MLKHDSLKLSFTACGLWLVAICAASSSALAQIRGICFNPDEEMLRRYSQVVEWTGTPRTEPPRSGPQANKLENSYPFGLASFRANEESLVEDDLLGGAGPSSDDPLRALGPDKAMEAKRAASKEEEKSYAELGGVDPHAEAFANTMYPSAMTCAKCHKKIYDEWRVSAHAYANVSPMFQRFEQAVSGLVQGTVGTFCMRCHAPIATQLKIPRYEALLDGPVVLREGITCVVCHRVVERYGRVNGERRIEPGNVYDPVVGNTGGDGIQQVIANADQFKVRTDPHSKTPAQDIHRGAIQFEQLADSSYCAGCHQVVVQPGIALEIVYQQYRSGPACKKGVSCQDCHMGIVPGKPLGYEYGACAEVGGKALRIDRKHSNHMFHGPSYPISHPGLFPHNEKLMRWKAKDLVAFQWRQGWGTEEFERSIAHLKIDGQFPKPWDSSQERRDARKAIDENLDLIEYKRANAIETIELSSSIQGPFFKGNPELGKDLKFSYIVSNTSDGHNMPSGSLGAQPQLWLNVVLIGPDGRRIFESGDLDRFGDLRDIQSNDVQQGFIPADLQLATYQTKFLVTNVKGTEREFFFPVPVDIDPIPFFRPGVVPYSVLNHPPLARMEAHSIAPLDSRTERYRVSGDFITIPGRYRLSVRMRSRVEPPYFARFVGLPDDSIRLLNERILDIHGQSFEFIIR